MGGGEPGVAPSRRHSSPRSQDLLGTKPGHLYFSECPLGSPAVLDSSCLHSDRSVLTSTSSKLICAEESLVQDGRTWWGLQGQGC